MFQGSGFSVPPPGAVPSLGGQPSPGQRKDSPGRQPVEALRGFDEISIPWRVTFCPTWLPEGSIVRPNVIHKWGLPVYLSMCMGTFCHTWVPKRSIVQLTMIDAWGPLVYISMLYEHVLANMGRQGSIVPLQLPHPHPQGGGGRQPIRTGGGFPQPWNIYIYIYMQFCTHIYILFFFFLFFREGGLGKQTCEGQQEPAHGRKPHQAFEIVVS